MPCLINSQTLKVISQVESFLYSDKQETPEEGWRIQWPKCCVLTYYKEDVDNSPKNQNYNNIYLASSQNFRQIIDIFLLKQSSPNVCIYIYIYIYIYIP